MRGTSIRVVCSAVLAASLAACGGGGGTAGTSALPGTGSSVGSTTTSTPAITTATKEQNIAASGLSVASNSLDANQFGSSSGATMFAISQASAAHRAAMTASTTGAPSASPSPAAPMCRDGVEWSQMSNANGSYTENVKFFYDQSCTQPRKQLTYTVSFTSTGGSAMGTETLYDSNGNVVDYKSDTLTFALNANGAPTQMSVLRTVAAAPSSAPFAQQAFSCVYGNPNTPIDCGNATVATLNEPQLEPHDLNDFDAPSPAPSPMASVAPTPSPTPFEIGYTGTTVATISATPTPSASATPPAGSMGWGWWNPQTQTLQTTIHGTGYIGAVGSMTVAAGTPPAWLIYGGTQVATVTGTGSVSITGNGIMSTAKVTVNDTANGLTFTMTSQNGRLTGNVTNTSGQTVATVTVDAGGNGTITYTSGAMAPVRDWIVLQS